jgi:hypothetical protein
MGLAHPHDGSIFAGWDSWNLGAFFESPKVRLRIIWQDWPRSPLFNVEMPDWVAFANAEFGRRGHTPAEEALEEAKKRAEALENRLRR